MDRDAEPRRQLNLLKVDELKLLCKEHNLATGGRKMELIERLIQCRQQATYHGADPAAGGSVSVAAPAATAPAPTPARRGQAVRRGTAAGRGGRATTAPRTRAATRMFTGLDSDVGPGDRAAGSPAVCRGRPLRCGLCASTFDPQSIHYTKDTERFWCPPCRFRAMDPFNPVIEGGGMLKYSFFPRPMLDFSLDLPDLRQWRREGVAVELRMLRVDCEKVVQAWPHSLKLLANGTEILEVKPPQEGHKRRDVPQNISPGLRPGANALRVKIQDDCHTDFALAVVLTSPRTDHELSSQVRLCPEAQARQRVRRLLARFQPKSKQIEEVVCLTSDTLKLRCPITMERVQDPVRGEHCQHLQCFGLAAYLMSNRQMRAFNNRWQCPVCTLILRPADICRDPYVARVIESVADDVEEVVVSPDGSWRCPGTPAPSARRNAPRITRGQSDRRKATGSSSPVAPSTEAALVDLDATPIESSAETTPLDATPLDSVDEAPHGDAAAQPSPVTAVEPATNAPATSSGAQAVAATATPVRSLISSASHVSASTARGRAFRDAEAATDVAEAARCLGVAASCVAALEERSAARSSRVLAPSSSSRAPLDGTPDVTVVGASADSEAPCVLMRASPLSVSVLAREVTVVGNNAETEVTVVGGDRGSSPLWPSDEALEETSHWPGRSEWLSALPSGVSPVPARPPARSAASQPKKRLRILRDQEDLAGQQIDLDESSGVE